MAAPKFFVVVRVVGRDGGLPLVCVNSKFHPSTLELINNCMNISGKKGSFTYVMFPPPNPWAIRTTGDKTSMASLTPSGAWKGTPTQLAFSLGMSQQTYLKGKWPWLMLRSSYEMSRA